MTVAVKPIQVVSAIDPAVVAASQTMATLVEVLVDGSVEQEIDVAIDGTVSFDANSAARGRLSLTVAGIGDMIPTDAAGLLNVYGNEIAVYRGVETSTARLFVPLGVFGIIRSTASDGPDGTTVAVSAQDRMGRFIAPESAFESAGEIASGTLAGAAIIAVLTEAWPDLPYNTGEFAAITVPLPLLAYDEAEDRSAFALGIATAIGAELYFDDLGELRIRPVPSATDADPVAEITEGEGGTLLDIERDFDRSRVTNRWKVRGQNPDNDPAAPVPTGVAVDDNENSPTYYFGQNTLGKTFGRRPDTYENSFIGTDTQAADCAAGLLARTIGAPDQVSLGAIVDPARRPSDVVWIERTRLGIAGAHILDTVEIPLSESGQMTATTRITQVLT